MITKEMTLGDVVNKHPEVIEILFKFGLHCVGCHVSAWETIEQGALGHGLSQEDLTAMLKEINDVIKNEKRV